MILPINSDVAPKSVFPEAKAAITRALALGQDSAEAHNSDAAVKFWFDRDFVGAEATARNAVALTPNYSLAHLYLAHILSNVGRHDEALQTIQSARALDPFSLVANAMYGQFLYHAGRVDDSVDQLRATLEMEPRFWIAHLAKSYERKGMYAEALAACENAWIFSEGNTEALSVAGYAHAVAGEKSKAEGKIHEMLERKREQYVPPYNLALVFAGLRETETAQHWLRQAFGDRDVHMTFLRDHKWDGMRSNPEFRQLMNSVGFLHD